MVAAYLIDPARRTYDLHELAADAGLAAAPAGAEEGQLSLAAEEGDVAGDPAVDARLAGELAERQRPRLKEFGVERVMNEVEMPLIEVLAEMERIGLRLDTERLAEIGAGMEEQIAELERQIYDHAGHEFTIGSPQQLATVFFDELGLTKKRRGKTGFSTDARVLGQLRDEHPIVDEVERWRELTKLKNTYLDSLPTLVDAESRIHTTFNQVTAATGRLSSTNPNLQNIPIRSEIGRPVRACFVAGPGNRLLSCDYNQVELRVLAHVAGEDVLRQIFASGEDVHSATAAGIIGADPDAITPAERSKAKMVNYGIAYGLSAFGLADRLNIEREEAQAYIDRYFERFPAVKAFIDEAIATAAEQGYVRTLMGRRRNIQEIRSGNRQRRHAGRAARGQHRDPGHRGRHHQGGDGQLPPGDGRGGPGDRARAPDPRRAPLRGPRGRDGRGGRDRPPRDGRRLRARPAAGGRRRRRRRLARRQVARPSRRGIRARAADLAAAAGARAAGVGAGAAGAGTARSRSRPRSRSRSSRRARPARPGSSSIARCPSRCCRSPTRWSPTRSNPTRSSPSRSSPDPLELDPEPEFDEPLPDPLEPDPLEVDPEPEFDESESEPLEPEPELVEPEPELSGATKVSSPDPVPLELPASGSPDPEPLESSPDRPSPDPLRSSPDPEPEPPPAVVARAAARAAAVTGIGPADGGEDEDPPEPPAAVSGVAFASVVCC